MKCMHSAPRLWMLVILLLAFALRVMNLSGQGLRGDETFGTDIKLHGISAAPAQLSAGRMPGVQLDWRLSNAPTSEATAVQLLGPDGKVVVQHDLALASGTPSGEESTLLYGILLAQELAPGD